MATQLDDELGGGPVQVGFNDLFVCISVDGNKSKLVIPFTFKKI